MWRVGAGGAFGAVVLKLSSAQLVIEVKQKDTAWRAAVDADFSSAPGSGIMAPFEANRFSLDFSGRRSAQSCSVIRSD